MSSAADFLPTRISLRSLQESAKDCRGCDLYKRATQTVFGAGSRRARVVMVGEMPADREDIAGEPFVGPAGRLLDEALQEAAIDRSDTYVTNAVKHFRWEERGKRRLHKKPRWSEVQACKPWLIAEIELIEPQLIVCLGATAAQALMGPAFRILKSRGELLESPWPTAALLATYHPSAILRAREKDRERMRAEFVADLRRAALHFRGEHHEALH